jgi:hypothetical protein
MGIARYGGPRAAIAIEAARIMYDEGVKQYFTAKRIAARRVLGKQGAKEARFRPQDLPSNGEIRDALLSLAELSEGPDREVSLFVMRVCALQVMTVMHAFAPRLIGSVASGHIRRGSDIDIQLFTDEPDGPELVAAERGWPSTLERVTIRKANELREYTHLHVELQFAIEFTIYPRNELRHRPRSSTDGKPIDRKSISALRAILASEHQARWESYQSTGILPELPALTDAQLGPFDGLLDGDTDAAAMLNLSEKNQPIQHSLEPAVDAESWALPQDIDGIEEYLPSLEEQQMLEGDEAYDPLPGFEDT